MKKTRRVLARIGIGVGAYLTFALASGALTTGLLWLFGVQLGFNPFSSDLTDTQRSQVIIGPMLVGTALLAWWRVAWLKRRKGSNRFWKYMNVEVLIVLPLSFLLNAGVASYMFVHGQHGADYGCGQEISLSRAYRATYPLATETGGGTAFAIDNHGTLLTAYHVIDGAKKITVDLGNTSSVVHVVKTNPQYDLALLHYDQPTPDFLPLTSTYNVADSVYAIGWPDNFYESGNPTITSGIISRDISSQDANDSGDKEPAGMAFIQTDAAINPGNSGGPLIDTCGAVGVVDSSSQQGDAQSTPDEGINYAISASAIRQGLGL